MSYSKIKSFSFSKDFKSIKVTSACNNVHPLTYYKQIILKENDESVFLWVESWVDSFISGGLQFNNQKHYINFVINETFKENNITSNSQLWASPYDYYAKWNQDLKKWIFPDDEKEEEYKNAVLKSAAIKKEITNNIINNTYKELYTTLKKEKYYLTNGYNYITNNGKRSFKYSGKEAQNIKKFNGLDKIYMQNYFAIKNYNYNFVEVSQ